MTNMVDGIGTTKYTYDGAGQLLSEDGPFASDTVTNGFSNRLRKSLSLQQPTGFWTNGLAYDVTKRLTNVASPAGGFGYLYDPALLTRQASRITLPNTSYVTNVYDANARLTQTYLKRSDSTTLDSYTYIYNPVNQRTNLTRLDASTVAYKYDPVGQLKVANSSLSTENRGYLYDSAWNLNVRTNNGAAYNFTVDQKNQLANTTDGSLLYDRNGNLTNIYGLRAYLYDDENRLIQLVDIFNPHSRTDFLYDGLGRLRKRTESVWQQEGASGFWAVSSETRYIYDGWRVIQERDGNNTPTVSYTRGSDLSGSLEGAGGIGGLLARSSGYSSGNWTNHNFYFADGNGNITYMLNGSQTMVASYRYDSFGNTISSNGTIAATNVYRFSSKEFHDNSAVPGSGIYYYGYRFYDPNLQRWINSDPAADEGFRNATPNAQEQKVEMNLYAFVRNAPSSWVDPYGLTVWFCSRTTDWGVGRHGYLWDDRPNPPGGHSCGQEGACGIGPTSEKGDKGPGSGDDDVHCSPITGSVGNEATIMAYCRKNINNGLWCPVKDDCQTKAQRVVRELAYDPPPTSRWNVPEQKFVYFLRHGFLGL